MIYQRPRFTFHYGPIQIKYISLSFIIYFSIYIPLWSYSNKHIKKCEMRFDEFTFHYGPIQI